MVWSMAKVYVISRLYSFYFNAAMSLKNMTDVIANKYSDNEYFYAWNDWTFSNVVWLENQFSSLLLLLVLLVLCQSHLVFFLCPLVLPLFRILLLHVSGLLLSFYIVCIFLLPLLSSITLLWSCFHIWILLIFFCPSTSSSLLSVERINIANQSSESAYQLASVPRYRASL